MGPLLRPYIYQLTESLQQPSELCVAFNQRKLLVLARIFLSAKWQFCIIVIHTLQIKKNRAQRS